MKCQISLDDELAVRIDNYARENYMSRSGLLSFAVTQYLNQVEVMSCIKDMAAAMRKIADTGVVDGETLKELEEFQKMSEMLLYNK